MKILVTGGAGFIGSNVADLLIERKDSVVIVDNLSSGSMDNVNRRARFYNVDIKNFKQLEDVFEKERPDKVVHAAAQVQVVKSMEDPVFDASTNILGSINVLECCKKFKIKKIIYLCTGGALYGNPRYLPADEKHPIDPISAYGVSKYTVEKYLYMYNVNYGLDFISLRFANVYGTRDSVGSGRVIPAFVNCLLNNKRPYITGEGKQTRDFIFVKDVAKAVVLALDKDTENRYFNIGSEEITSINELFNLIKKILKSDIKPEYINERKGEVQEIYLKAGLAWKELAWKAEISLEEGLKQYIDSLKRNLFI